MFVSSTAEGRGAGVGGFGQAQRISESRDYLDLLAGASKIILFGTKCFDFPARFSALDPKYNLVSRVLIQHYRMTNASPGPHSFFVVNHDKETSGRRSGARALNKEVNWEQGLECKCTRAEHCGTGSW